MFKSNFTNRLNQMSASYLINFNQFRFPRSNDYQNLYNLVTHSGQASEADRQEDSSCRSSHFSNIII